MSKGGLRTISNTSIVQTCSQSFLEGHPACRLFSQCVQVASIFIGLYEWHKRLSRRLLLLFGSKASVFCIYISWLVRRPLCVLPVFRLFHTGFSTENRNTCRPNKEYRNWYECLLNTTLCKSNSFAVLWLTLLSPEKNLREYVSNRALSVDIFYAILKLFSCTALMTTLERVVRGTYG